MQRLLLSLAAVLAAILPSYSLPADFYASSSALAQGKWARVAVKESGMQFISNATLRNLGFSDPDKVNVYGYGGQMLPERLYDGMPDDLPAVPSVRTASGIVFFGHGNVLWEHKGNGNYTHTLNPYASTAYYFISDRDENRTSPAEASTPATSYGDPLTIFTERIVHEQDLLAPSNTGRLILGEDFRTQNSRMFQFNLPGIKGDASVLTCFGAKVTNGKSTLVFSANGERLESSSSDNINGVGSQSTFISLATSKKTIPNPGEKLSFGIQYSHTGAIFTAALDYIEVTYPRELRLKDDELYFYLPSSHDALVKVEGCSETTMIWDVTDPVRPQLVDFSLQGTAATFNTPTGYREYVAFNPQKITRQATPAGKIQNQDIHGMEIPEMVIISPDAYRQAAQRIADLHAQTDGLKAVVLSPEAVYNEFSSGSADVTAFRKMLKMWYDKGIATDGRYTRYCLIMSRPTYDNKMVTPIVKRAGYPRVPIWQSSSSTSSTSSYSTDDYIGMLDDNSTALNLGSAKIHVAVGRMPVKSVAEANTAVAKLEKYLKSPAYGSWRNSIMVIADDQDNGVHLTQAERVINGMRSVGNGSDFIYEKLYLDAYKMVSTGTGPTYPDAKRRMFDKLSEGVLFIDYIGHANPKSWGHEKLLTWNDITSMSNTNLPFIYAATCEFLRWDDDEVSGAEEMWLNPTAGVIGMICPSREVMITSNGNLNEFTSRHIFKRDAEGKAMRVGDIMINGKNDYAGDSNKLRYALIGDPAMRLPSPDMNVAIDSIGDIYLDNAEESPVIEARSSVRVAGRITDGNGDTVDNFNGIVEIQLYDAEKVVQTLGNGKDGVESLYNDRKTRLFIGRTNVVAGEWSTIITMPSEIENNYSPALISAYAFEESGREANGACDDLYVFGYAADAAPDNEGPEITGFFLNSESFADGATVSPSPVVMANVRDASGINLSDAGIGHAMKLTIDGKSSFNDVSLYYTPDSDDHLGGSISYPLQGIEPGEHTLSLTVWDNANNSTTVSLTFNVSASWQPGISQLGTDVNPASTSVNFIVGTDGVRESTECLIEVFNIGGRRVWSGTTPPLSVSGTTVTLGWDLCDYSGARVPRGIYIYRATLSTPEGAVVTQTRKLAVTAQ